MQTIYITEIEKNVLEIKHYKDDVLIAEFVTPAGSEDALAIGKIIEEYMEKGEEHYKFDMTYDYKTFIHMLEG